MTINQHVANVTSEQMGGKNIVFRDKVDILGMKLFSDYEDSRAETSK